MKRYFKVLDGTGIPFGFDFTGQVLEFITKHKDVESYYCLLQPEKDSNGKKCAFNGVIWISANKLEEVKLKSVTLSDEKWQNIISLLESDIHHIIDCLNQEMSWYGDDSPGVKILKSELEEAKNLYEEVKKQVE